MASTINSSTKVKEKRENPFLNIFLNVVAPSIIMAKFSGPEHLGPIFGLVIALVFPVGYGLFDFVSRKKYNFFSLLGLISVLLTGGIGLFKLSRNWMIAKETLIPCLFGVATFISNYTHYPLLKTFLKEILDFEKINEAFANSGHRGHFDKKLRMSSHFLAATFFVSAVLNYFLAVFVLKGTSGTTEFNESLGKMTALSFPVITVPMMIMTGCILFYLCSSIKKLTSLEIETFLKQHR